MILAMNRTLLRSQFTMGLLLAALALLVGCEAKAPSGLATIPMEIGSKTFTLEVADRTD